MPTVYCTWQTDRQTDRRKYYANSRSYCVMQYDRLIIIIIIIMTPSQCL